MAKKRKERTRNAGTLTDAQYFSKIRSALRHAFRYWKPGQIALQRASRTVTVKNRKRKEYQCATCKKWFNRKEVQIDHIEECGSLSSYDDIVPFIKRLTKEDPDSYQILCKEDHKNKGKLYNGNKRNKTTSRRSNRKSE